MVDSQTDKIGLGTSRLGTSKTMNTGIGQPVRRKEDARLLVGAGRFSDDVDLPRQAWAFVIRSVHAHARIKGIATEAARAHKGVLAVLTGADYKADGLKPIPPDASTTMPIEAQRRLDRKSTRLNSSHLGISYAVFCL